jgi:hypothetical protein
MPEVQNNFKMAAAAILEIEVRAIKWAITTRFRCKLVHRLRKDAEFKNHNTGTVKQVSRWRLPPF